MNVQVNPLQLVNNNNGERILAVRVNRSVLSRFIVDYDPTYTVNFI